VKFHRPTQPFGLKFQQPASEELFSFALKMKQLGGWVLLNRDEFVSE
jgi:hypothetical protein